MSLSILLLALIKRKNNIMKHIYVLLLLSSLYAHAMEMRESKENTIKSNNIWFTEVYYNFLLNRKKIKDPVKLVNLILRTRQKTVHPFWIGYFEYKNKHGSMIFSPSNKHVLELHPSK